MENLTAFKMNKNYLKKLTPGRYKKRDQSHFLPLLLRTLRNHKVLELTLQSKNNLKSKLKNVTCSKLKYMQEILSGFMIHIFIKYVKS